jgi:hypothetical protein
MPEMEFTNNRSAAAERVGRVGPLPGGRLRSLIIPREHGAWGMLLVPLATGAFLGFFAGRRVLPLLLLTVAVLTIFWMRTPVESWLGTSPVRAHSDAERRTVMQVALALAAVAALALTGLLWDGQNSYLLVLGALSGLAFGAQAILKKFGRTTRMAAQVVGAMGLTSTAPAAYYVVTGHADGTAGMLWLANWLFAGNQIHFVQLRIHASRVAGRAERLAQGRSFLFGQAVLAAVLVAVWRLDLVPGLVVAAFVPAILRGVVWFLQEARPLAVRHLGWSELAHAVTFGVLLVSGFHLGR